jgi:hypothetical protein
VSEILKERDHLRDLSVDGRIILKLMKEIGRGDMDWINLAEDRYSGKFLSTW